MGRRGFGVRRVTGPIWAAGISGGRGRRDDIGQPAAVLERIQRGEPKREGRALGVGVLDHAHQNLVVARVAGAGTSRRHRREVAEGCGDAAAGVTRADARTERREQRPRMIGPEQRCRGHGSEQDGLGGLGFVMGPSLPNRARTSSVSASAQSSSGSQWGTGVISPCWGHHGDQGQVVGCYESARFPDRVERGRAAVESAGMEDDVAHGYAASESRRAHRAPSDRPPRSNAPPSAPSRARPTSRGTASDNCPRAAASCATSPRDNPEPAHPFQPTDRAPPRSRRAREARLPAWPTKKNDSDCLRPNARRKA